MPAPSAFAWRYSSHFSLCSREPSRVCELCELSASVDSCLRRDPFAFFREVPTTASTARSRRLRLRSPVFAKAGFFLFSTARAFNLRGSTCGLESVRLSLPSLFNNRRALHLFLGHRVEALSPLGWSSRHSEPLHHRCLIAQTMSARHCERSRHSS